MKGSACFEVTAIETLSFAGLVRAERTKSLADDPSVTDALRPFATADPRRRSLEAGQAPGSRPNST